MRLIKKVCFAAFCLLCCLGAAAQSDGFDVFVPIGKYITQGNSDALSAWFADNLEVSVLSKGSTASKSQARQIMKSFFESYTPSSFNITHTAGRANMKYVLGELKAGGERFHVTIFVSCKGEGNSYTIQQIKIDRI